ncbi:MAG: 4Fe-4S binding protein [Sphaerochaetaceae bacterium]
MNKRLSIKILSIFSEILALTIFVFLFLNNKLQMWLLIFGISALLSIFLGRFYCSWICPMNTLFKPINWLYSKLKIKKIKTPSFFKWKGFRIVILVLFVVTMFLVKKMGLKINVLLYMTAFSVFLNLFFEENLWHRHICPFGTILSLTSRPSFYRMEINENDCISCGKCQKVCPTNSIITLENKKRQNVKNECLLCGRCVDVCPKSVCVMKFGGNKVKISPNDKKNALHI